jgi:integrase
MATISKVSRKSGDAYKAMIRLRGVNPFSKTFKLKKDAKVWAIRMERDIDEARAYGNRALRNMTLAELIKERNKEYPSKDKSVISNLNWWKREYGSMRLLDIDRTVIREAMVKLKEGDATRGNGKGKSKSVGRKRAPATLNRYKAALSSIFEYGRVTYDLPENPCRQIKALPENNARIRFLTENERKTLLTACRKSEWSGLYLLVLTAITTGARQGELLRLRWADIDMQRRIAYVSQTKNGEPRVLPLVDNVVEELLKHPRPIKSDTLLFGSHRVAGKPFEFRKHWDKAVKDSGVENFHFHDLRHTCASYLAQNGATLLQIADVLGHKQLEVTKRYSHLCIDHKQELVDRVLGEVK